MWIGKETHNLQWCDILQVDDISQEYIVYNTERQTRTGVNEINIQLAKSRAYAIPDIPQKDPVGLYKLYKHKRPAYMNGPESPFFLSINLGNPKPGQCMYKKPPMGINLLYGIIRNMMTDTGLSPSDKRITPYSVQKHLIQKLSDEEIPANQIVQISGYKSINSLNNYSNLSPAQSRNISNIVSNVPALPYVLSLSYMKQLHQWHQRLSAPLQKNFIQFLDINSLVSLQMQ
ncbi:hypothetical protein ACJMK2_002397 [Sinanodonta woodiana]|uniref:Uncharacterized protein n=1 Tax=Sinanodonta woodiana TaxID=1069815 RepID=A0ABD3XV60_SINWO